MKKPKRQKFRQETVLHSYFFRPLGLEVVRWLWDTKVTANQLTVFRLILNVIALIFFLQATFWTILIGFVVFHINEILDHADGLLARLKNQTSKMGHFMEIFFDTLLSSSSGLFGFIIAYSGYLVSHNFVYIYLFILLSVGFLLNALFKQAFVMDDGEDELEKDRYEYIPIFTSNWKTSIKNILRTIYIWQNEVLLFGLLLLIPLLPLGVDSLFIAFLLMALLNNLVWMQHVVQYYLSIKNR